MDLDSVTDLVGDLTIIVGGETQTAGNTLDTGACPMDKDALADVETNFPYIDITARANAIVELYNNAEQKW